ncbi:MAG: glycosyltransferase family 1 protein, partial [Polyangiaceae bacterium]
AGGDVARYVAVGDVDGFVAAALDALAHRSDAKLRDARVAHAKQFSWRAHARTILDAYLALE